MVPSSSASTTWTWSCEISPSTTMTSHRPTTRSTPSRMRSTALPTKRGPRTTHLYGHSAGGAVALAYAASHGDRVHSLAVDEPASDFTDDGNAVYGWLTFDEAVLLPPAESMAAFMRLQVADDVILPEPPAGEPPPWMAKRPAAIRAFLDTLRRHRVEPADYAGFAAPVYFGPRFTNASPLGGDADPARSTIPGLHRRGVRRTSPPQHVARRRARTRGPRRLWRSEEQIGSDRLTNPDARGNPHRVTIEAPTEHGSDRALLRENVRSYTPPNCRSPHTDFR